MKGNTLL